MKKLRPIILMLLLPVFSFAYAAATPSMEVTVTNAAGKVAYKGVTSSDGSFTTGNLEPGNYVVQFDAKSKIAKGARFSLIAKAGKYNVSDDSVEGGKFVNAGVAMRISVAGKTKITGQVAPAGALAKQAQTATNGNAKSKYSGPVKIINGKRYVWVTPHTGSVEGGHWAEEGSDEANQAEGLTNTRVQGNQAPQRSSGGRY